MTSLRAESPKRNSDQEALLQMDSLPHILVVDDDAEILEIIAEYLTEEGFRVSCATDGRGMQLALKQSTVHLIILDIRLRGEDGLTLAADLRQHDTDTGIVFLSRKDEVVDRVVGLEIGADDYLAKPFHLRELLARVRSVLRRRETQSATTSMQKISNEARHSIFRFAEWQLDRASRELKTAVGGTIELSSSEFDLLVAFLDHPRQALSRDRLLDLARGREANLFDRSIDVLVGRLRRKIETNPKRPELIKTIRGAGYMLAVDVKRN